MPVEVVLEAGPGDHGPPSGWEHVQRHEADRRHSLEVRPRESLRATGQTADPAKLVGSTAAGEVARLTVWPGATGQRPHQSQPASVE